MLEVVIEAGWDIVTRSERIIETARRLVFSGSLEQPEALAVYREAERLMEVMFMLTDAVNLLRSSSERLPEAARQYSRTGIVPRRGT
jgi:hypothetical protein